MLRKDSRATIAPQAQRCAKHAKYRRHAFGSPVCLPDLAGEPRPARETMVVWFHKPVKIGDRVLQGNYVIEHDNNWMARGGPCTYIYAASDLRLPVVAFHCRHLERAPSTAPTLVLRSLGEANGMKELVGFQFAREIGAPGCPEIAEPRLLNHN